jgi:hypothetical protein
MTENENNIIYYSGSSTDTCMAPIPSNYLNDLAGKDNGYNKEIVFKCDRNSNGTYSGRFEDK